MISFHYTDPAVLCITPIQGRLRGGAAELWLTSEVAMRALAAKTTIAITDAGGVTLPGYLVQVVLDDAMPEFSLCDWVSCGAPLEVDEQVVVEASDA